MSDADDVFAQATDNLVSLYRNIERSTLDLPLVSFMPVLILFWSVLKFYFFLVVGVFLIMGMSQILLK
jgi:membrane protein insertase Oxa1/YidC/SpoIIIJ